MRLAPELKQREELWVEAGGGVSWYVCFFFLGGRGGFSFLGSFVLGFEIFFALGALSFVGFLDWFEGWIHAGASVTVRESENGVCTIRP